MAKSTVPATESISIKRIVQHQVTMRLIGTTPLYLHAMSAKAQRTLLLGGGKKTAAEKVHLKHDPENEYRAACYTVATGPTLLCMPASAIKSAMATAALVTPGLKKTDVQRLVYLPEMMVPIWGTPFLKLDVVRSADMNRTPDVRSRPFLPEWVCEVQVCFATPHLDPAGVSSLLANAGLTVGIGDFRQEKGRGSFGSFMPVDDDSAADFERIKASGGRDVQVAAYENPEPYDDTTRELMAMVHQERMRRAA